MTDLGKELKNFYEKLPSDYFNYSDNFICNILLQ